MDDQRFASLVSRLEQTAVEHPHRYLATVLAVALLGMGVLGIAIVFAILPAAMLAGLLFLVVITGGKALIVLLKLGKLLVLLILPAWVMIKSSIQLLFSRFPRPQGRALALREAPALFARLGELRTHMKGPRIHHVLLTEELNAAIVQHPRFGLFGWEENYLILGLPLLQTLSEQEALAVVAHEYGHLSGHHGRLGGFIYRFRSAWGRMQALSGQWQDWGSRLIARLFHWYAPYFNAYTFVLARQNEYIADRTSAEIVGTRSAANALMRSNVAAQFEAEVFWPAVQRQVADAPQPPESFSRAWDEALRDRLDAPTRSRFLEAAGQRRTDHLDTHPALVDRLKAMGVALDAGAAQELAPPPRSAAQAWLGESLETICGEFDRDWRARVSSSWSERHAYLSGRRQRLAALESQPALEAGERWEYIGILAELKPEQDLLPLVNALLEAAPDHPGALYRRGALLLQQGDESGIPDLERVMSLDPEAILPACEAAWQFYRERDPDKAEHYRSRWMVRSDYLERVRAELATLPADATLVPHDLEADQLEQIRRILREHGKYIRRAYVMSRILKADPALRDYVLAFETKRFTLGEKGPAVVKRLVQLEYPVGTFIVHLGSEPYKRFRKQIRKMNIEPLSGW